MGKYTLMVSALGGAIGGYVISNEKMRHEMAEASDAGEMAKTFGYHLASDGRKVVRELRSFVGHRNIGQKLKSAGTYATARLHGARRRLTRQAKKSAVKN